VDDNDEDSAKESTKEDDEELVNDEESAESAKTQKKKPTWEQRSKRVLYTELVFLKRGLKEAKKENRVLLGENKSLSKSLAAEAPNCNKLLDLCVTHNGVKDDLRFAQMKIVALKK